MYIPTYIYVCMHCKNIFSLGWFTIDCIKRNIFFVELGKKGRRATGIHRNQELWHPHRILETLNIPMTKRGSFLGHTAQLTVAAAISLYLTEVESFLPNNNSDKNRYLRPFAL